MRVFQILKNKKLFFLQVFLTLYIGINLIGGERGLVSYFEKDIYENKLYTKNMELKKKLEAVEHKNKLLSENIDLDYLDTLYRTKLKFGTKDEILIKLQ
jgi:cell division protein DivIC